MKELLDVARGAIVAHLEGQTFLPPDLGKPGQALFVTLRNPDGSLRGCIGHLAPQMASLGDEISAVAVSAAVNDSRFPPVRRHEVDGLSFELSLLSPPEPIAGPEELDPRRYGVVVSAGYRRGVLLPDLPGVDTVEQQIAICRRKGGIGEREPVELSRFTVDKVS